VIHRKGLSRKSDLVGRAVGGGGWGGGGGVGGWGGGGGPYTFRNTVSFLWPVFFTIRGVAPQPNSGDLRDGSPKKDWRFVVGGSKEGRRTNRILGYFQVRVNL